VLETKGGAARHAHHARLVERGKGMAALRAVVAHPCDEASLRAAVEAAEHGLLEPTLVGPRHRIERLAAQHGIPLSGLRLVDVPHSHAAAARAVDLIRAGEASILVKGSLHTDELMAEVLRKDTGLRTGRRVSQVFVMDLPIYPKPLFVTDAAVHIFPTLEDKVDICRNVVDLAHALGIARPKVALLSAVETVTSKIPSTIDAAALCKMADRRQITGAILDGPLAMDNAVDAEAARAKGIDSPVAGDADVLLAPDLEAGNMVAKLLSFLGGAEAAGIVLGARVPIVLTSRSDGVRARLASAAVAVLLCHARRSLQA